MAAMHGHSDVAAVLIQHGADPCSTDMSGIRPRDLLRTNQVFETFIKKFENEQVQHFILILCLEHVAATMTLVEANALFKEDMSCISPNEHENKKLDRLKNWTISLGIRTIREFKARLAGAGHQNLTVAAANHYAEIAKKITDMSADCYGTFCQAPLAHRHMISTAGCPTEQRCEMSMETDSYQYDAYLAHASDDEEAVDEVRGQLESNGVRCCEPPLPGSIKIKSMCESVEMAKRTVPFFSKTSLSDNVFLNICDVAEFEAKKRKEDVVIPVTMDVGPESLPPVVRVRNCINFQSQNFIPSLVDAIKGPACAPLYGQLRDENKNMKQEIAAKDDMIRELRQQLEESRALNRRLQAELEVTAPPK
ncbi:uncharacterized protein LOC106163266 [Lingula anatina]|uniref:Uncharacterized protein LOC106163266 n=1 Tax=Lingula anatina TaxID=7574 RepID=A0A1S3IEH9_LINAN|nr:uncharacterized protein LOC106163266 [Lingula anatina]|eukprot:XP_013396261.1 uncharacterized protein LOC106163266 [Lingula anatina]